VGAGGDLDVPAEDNVPDGVVDQVGGQLPDQEGSRSGAAGCMSVWTRRPRRLIAGRAAARLTSPSPLVHVQRWAREWAVGEALGVDPELLNDDRIGRALDAIAPHLDQIAGSVGVTAIAAFGPKSAIPGQTAPSTCDRTRKNRTLTLGDLRRCWPAPLARAPRGPRWRRQPIRANHP
jgi:hypothetical protein